LNANGVLKRQAFDIQLSILTVHSQKLTEI